MLDRAMTFKIAFLLCVYSTYSVLGNALLTKQETNDPSMQGCGVSIINPQSGKIVGGANCVEGEYPWQLSMEMQPVPMFTDFQHICGASIINKEWGITAAHCIAGGYFTRYRVIAGAYNITSRGRRNTAHMVMPFVHEGYNPMLSLKNDIALLRLGTPFDMEAAEGYINGVCIPASSEVNTTSGMATVTGWGTTSEGGSLATTLQAVDVPIITNEECKQSYGDDKIEDSMLCAGHADGGKDSCQGDSGGPLIQRSDGGIAKLVGIVSWGKGCAQKGYPGVYTRTASYTDWISRTMQRGIPQPPQRPPGTSLNWLKYLL